MLFTKLKNKNNNWFFYIFSMNFLKIYAVFSL
jgi:hypothetical protein